jgi:hypothetical protein
MNFGMPELLIAAAIITVVVIANLLRKAFIK